MAKNIREIYVKSLKERSKDGKKGWEAEDSEAVALDIIRAQTDSKIPADRMARITAALQITPRRIVQFIQTELKAAGADLDETSGGYLRTLVDLTEIRKQVVEAKLVEKGDKGKKKKSTVAELIND